MKTKSINLILAIMLASVAVFNFQSISATTPEKLPGRKAVTKESDLPRILSRYITYPSEALNKELQGTVKVMAVIEADGSVSGIRILQDIGGSCAKEVSRAILKMHFAPYMENGIAARHALVVNVNFILRK